MRSFHTVLLSLKAPICPQKLCGCKCRLEWVSSERQQREQEEEERERNGGRRQRRREPGGLKCSPLLERRKSEPCVE